ncbi:MAG: tRNA (adenosine(37)-N6)-threonylcarbamoyltransferase complex transferase subunit TsaD, partial [Capnocytophaga sp.]|nr:tRNA (adenosine(37)-N6)-threonylcarbamoyltransferase complex transferase subunit TsaD [Capnocytophaga sp.]
QQTIVEILMSKLQKAVKQTNIKQIAIGGGVSANSAIRNTLLDLGEKHGWQTYIPKFEYCTDNAAMIGIVGYYKFLQNHFTNQQTSAKARLKIEE